MRGHLDADRRRGEGYTKGAFYMADITCPECGHTATVSVKTVNVEDILQLQRSQEPLAKA